MDKAYVRSVYRRLWRAGIFAIHGNHIHKRAIRDKLRFAFRTETELPSEYEISNTEKFLRTAGTRQGVERNLVRRLCQIHVHRVGRFKRAHGNGFETSEKFYHGYERAIDMLNRTAGLCLR